MHQHNTFFKFFLIAFFLLSAIATNAAEYYFYVQFVDKNDSPYSLDRPLEFLSQRAVDRRAFFNVLLDETDLPVNPAYLSALENVNARIYARSKWLNGATIAVEDSVAVMPQVRALNFVQWVEYTGESVSGLFSAPQKTQQETQETTYGNAYDQINQLNGLYLHNAGYRGEDTHIAVIDAGFKNVSIDTAFDSLRQENRLLGTKDFVNPTPTSDVYNEHSHGAKVLSTMAANVPNRYIGTAPKASYWLLRTEKDGTEYRVEPDLWISAVEFADSAGVDVINTSLGYSEFDDSSMNFTYTDMNGETVRASIAATIAARKGMIIVVSAGNEGNKAWKYITAPADAKDIITVGAVAENGTVGNFSSFGASADGRVKPEVSARGVSAWTTDTNGNFATGNGTSFASPIMAGAMACLLQAVKENNISIDLPALFDAVFRSADQYNATTIDNQRGYGIPDFRVAWESLNGTNGTNESVTVSNNFTINNLNNNIIVYSDKIIQNAVVRVFSSTGKLVASVSLTEKKTIIAINHAMEGIMLVNTVTPEGNFTKKIIFQ